MGAHMKKWSVIAVMLVEKTVTFKAAPHKARMQDPTILRHRAKVKRVVLPGMSAASPGRDARGHRGPQMTAPGFAGNTLDVMAVG